MYTVTMARTRMLPPFAAVAVVVLDENDRGAIFMSIAGFDQKSALDCTDRIMARMGMHERVVVSAPDRLGIVEYSFASGAGIRTNVAWLGNGVMAWATDPSDK